MKKCISIILLFILLAVSFCLTAKEEKLVNDDKKISICHVPPGNTENSHVITIGQPALNAHLAHGDFLLSEASFQNTEKGKIRCSKKTKTNANPSHWVEIRPQ